MRARTSSYGPSRACCVVYFVVGFILLWPVLVFFVWPVCGPQLNRATKKVVFFLLFGYVCAVAAQLLWCDTLFFSFCSSHVFFVLLLAVAQFCFYLCVCLFVCLFVCSSRLLVCVCVCL